MNQNSADLVGSPIEMNTPTEPPVVEPKRDPEDASHMTVIPRFNGAVRPAYILVTTVTKADAVYKSHLSKNAYTSGGISVEGSKRYIKTVPAYFAHLTVRGDSASGVLITGRCLEHLLKRDDLNPELKRELNEALSFFTAIAPEKCWGKVKHPWRRGPKI